ncbi:hypothetical protein ACFQI7_25515 [Paenibacillus allorhizosphaerae]|uniref:Phage protein n=1 Tax=Paenibacillus allorhizosphaerae TaxID=2849866 RepID=A0ABM8VJC3_9BACL|nr:hypothetical protein [Paenibacillus allorhizosphaerae]CAG7645291.1 hypothetical protein PAECIP111802_03480 [Paenibacillus allorhizosphaerae]
MLTSSQIKRKLKELPPHEVIELLHETVKTNKEARVFISVKLQGEPALLELLEKCKEQIRKQFYPDRGLPKLRTDKVKEALSSMEMAGQGTDWPFELMVYFCEVAVRYIHETGDIFEDMGDLLTDTYEAVIQALNMAKTPELYEKYRDRMKAIVETTGCECWGICDSLEGSYSMLKWAENDMTHVKVPKAPNVIDFAATSEWLKMPDNIRRMYIENVWCGQCSSVTVIEEFSVQLDKYGIVLRGKCSKCSHKVARVIEK